VKTVCYDDGVLQAFLDGEVTSDKKTEIKKHLQNCGTCRRALAQVKENQSFTEARLEGYMQSLVQSGFDAGAAWSRLKSDRLPKWGGLFSGKGVLEMLARYRMAVTAAVIVLALAISFSFSSVRTAAGELLAVFRVEKVKTVSINPSDIAGIEKAIREGTGQIDIESFGRIEFAGEHAPAKVTLEEAQGAVDFRIKLPPGLPEGYNLKEIYKESGGSLNFTLDTAQANQILKSFGSEKLLPDGLNGRTFTVKIPATVYASYAGPGDDIMVWQGKSPELIAPVSEVSAIRDALLALPFLPENLRSQLAAINDWQHTFVIPNIGGSSQEVDVAGSQGVFITPVADGNVEGRGRSGSLIWQKDGVVYAVSGKLGLEQALEIAGDMR